MSRGSLTILAIVGVSVSGCDRGGPNTVDRKSAEQSSPARSTTDPQTATPVADPQPAAFAGSESCRSCHAEAFHAWRTSNHAFAERELDPALDDAAFTNQKPITHGSLTSSVRKQDGKYQVVTQGRDGKTKPFTAARVLGHTPLRQFLIPADGGRFQMTELAFDPRRGDWFDVFGDEDRKPHEWGHWSNRGMTWNAMCADCHNTNLHKNYDGASDSYATTYSEHGVGCEACHGPGRAHVEWQLEHLSDERVANGTDPILRTSQRLSEQRRLVDTCGTCHARRSELRESFTPGEPFLDSFVPEMPSMDETWYADGQVHEEDYVYSSFLMSRMFSEGVGCLDCHNAHDLTLRLPGNQLCLRCHTGKIDPGAHSHHDVAGAGGQCVNCHMPHTTYMQRHARRDHGFTIPDPLLTKESGVPNACNRCHTDRDADWALDAVERWYGDLMQRNTRARARLVARARRRAAGVENDLVHLVQQEQHPTWRAIGAGLLGDWAPLPNVRAALVALLNDESGLVRMTAARVLEGPGPQTLPQLDRLLSDPLRAVRVAAAWSLGARLEQSAPAAAELRGFLDHNADQPAGLLALATHLRQRGRASEAVERLRKAIEWAPESDALHYSLGITLASLGETTQALAAVKRACELAPKQPFLWYSLGLARGEAGDLHGAVEAFERALALDASDVKVWYNLGLARNALGDHEAAIQALAKATQIAPRNTDLLFTFAAVLRDAGRIEEARDAAASVLNIDPNHERARALLISLRERP